MQQPLWSTHRVDWEDKDLKIEDDLKNEEDLQTENSLKHEDDL